MRDVSVVIQGQEQAVRPARAGCNRQRYLRIDANFGS